MRRASLGLIAGALLLAGCGGSTTLSTSALRTEATSVCTSANTKMSAIPTPSSPSGTVAFLSRGITVLRPELTQLRSLKPSADVAQVYRISLTAFSHKLEALTTTVRNIDSGGDPVKELQALQAELTPFESSEDGAWQALQIPACVDR